MKSSPSQQGPNTTDSPRLPAGSKRTATRAFTRNKHDSIRARPVGICLTAQDDSVHGTSLLAEGSDESSQPTLCGRCQALDFGGLSAYIVEGPPELGVPILSLGKIKPGDYRYSCPLCCMFISICPKYKKKYKTPRKMIMSNMNSLGLFNSICNPRIPHHRRLGNGQT